MGLEQFMATAAAGPAQPAQSAPADALDRFMRYSTQRRAAAGLHGDESLDVRSVLAAAQEEEVAAAGSAVERMLNTR